MLERIELVTQEEISRRAKILVEQSPLGICSIYAEFDDEMPTHLGSGVLVASLKETWLITARHLLEEGRKAARVVAVSDQMHQPVFLNRRFIKVRDKDVDLALCALSDGDVENLNVEPIDGKKFFTFPNSRRGRAICTIGFPNSRNKIDRYGFNSGTILCVTGPQLAASDINKDEGYDKEFVMQRYQENDLLDASGKRTNALKLKGLSGGLTFDLGLPLDPEVISGSEEAIMHPVGICIRHDFQNGVITSVRPHNLIRERIEGGYILQNAAK